MQNLASQFNGNPGGFLNAFSPIHVIWHARRGVIVGGKLRPVGFLTFHHSVIQAYTIVLKSKGKTLPKKWGPNYDKAIDSDPDPVQFSSEIEDWHNGVHNSDMSLMNPATNIKKPRFWALHNFIDQKFMSWQSSHRKLTSKEHSTV